MKHMKGLKKTAMTAAGITGGAAMLGVGMYLFWNSKKMKALRTVRRVEKILARTGEALQSVSEIV